MADKADSEDDPQKAANLARIRDNQRRSRARRSEYLKDLETRYRNCEQAGVSASAEIQAAAKGVVEENRRLRNLLKAYGVSDAEIDRASGSRGSLAANALETMANSRRPCGSGCSSSPAQDVQTQQTQHLQQIQPAPQPTRQQPILPRQPQPTLQIPSNIATQQAANQIPSPCSLPDRRQSYEHEPPLLFPNHQDPQAPFSAYEIPMDDHHHQPLAQQFHNPNMAYQTPQSQVQQYEGLSSCQMAASTIRTFSPDAGYELERELGCRAPGEECSVPNLKVFNVIDRYTGGSG